jgi:hypothetical protein
MKKIRPQPDFFRFCLRGYRLKNFSLNATAPFFACTTYTMTNQVARDNQVQAEYADIVIFLRAR